MESEKNLEFESRARGGLKICLVGAGPAALLTAYELSKSTIQIQSLSIFEKFGELGLGMPYSHRGARPEHVTNVSSDELPELPQTLVDWVKNQPDKLTDTFDICKGEFHEKEVVPRLLFGLYLQEQFEKVKDVCAARNLVVARQRTKVTDINRRDDGHFEVFTEEGAPQDFDVVIICTGHKWKCTHESLVPGYFDSPYPPDKLFLELNHKVVIRGSSLTAVDAIETLAEANGRFTKKENKWTYELKESSKNFRLEMHSRGGLLPSPRVHLDEPHTSDSSRIDEEVLAEHRSKHDGFVKLDFVYREAFLKPLKDSHKEFYESIKNLTLEEFFSQMMSHRNEMPPFELLRKEYLQSLDSIKNEASVPWKETLASLSFAMNYPAKHFCAEDMLRLKKTLMPLISVIIGFLPQSACGKLLALHDAGVLSLVDDMGNGEVKIDDSTPPRIIYESGGDSSKTSEVCETFVDCIGQRPFEANEFPFRMLLNEGAVSAASLRFCSMDSARKYQQDNPDAVFKRGDSYFLRVPGMAIDDFFRPVNQESKSTDRLYLLAVPFIGGHNPDYSGLDFCEQAAKAVVSSLIARPTGAVLPAGAEP